MRLNLAKVKKILSEYLYCPQCKEEAEYIDIQVGEKEIYMLTCRNTHKWEATEVITHRVSLIRATYLAHTAKLPETEQEAKDHFDNCEWCQNYVRDTEQVDALSMNLQRSADLHTLYK